MAELGPENHPQGADLEASGYYLTHAKEMIDEIRKNNKVRLFTCTSHLHQSGCQVFEEEYSLIMHHLRIVEQMAASQAEGDTNNRNLGSLPNEEEEWSDEEEDDEDMEVAEHRN